MRKPQPPHWWRWPVDHREGGRAGAGDDHRAVLAAERAGMGDVDVVEDPDAAERPVALRELRGARVPSRPPAMPKQA